MRLRIGYIIPLLTTLLTGCEEPKDIQHSEYHYAVIKAGTRSEPVWMEMGLRKKGSDYVFGEAEDNVPQLIPFLPYLSQENMDSENVELVQVEIIIVH